MSTTDLIVSTRSDAGATVRHPAGNRPRRTPTKVPPGKVPPSRPASKAPADRGPNNDVLAEVEGIVDVLDNHAFVRTSGYVSGADDAYVSMAQIKQYGLRRGDAVTGAVRAPREGEQRRDKYNPLVRVDTVNGTDPEEARRRPEFYQLTPLYPQERLRLETEPHVLTTRVIDLIMPIGKGQRALIVSPPKAGKTMIQQAIANAISQNHPECHLMVVLVDERPEEVTDMERTVKGEVIASTFDRPPRDHTTVAELAIERAKRLVELGRTWSCCSTRSPGSAGRTTWPPRRRAASSPAASTRRRSTRPSGSSAPPATSRTAARSPSSRPRWWRPVR